jgi:iron complex outermembrane recepter protein
MKVESKNKSAASKRLRSRFASFGTLNILAASVLASVGHAQTAPTEPKPAAEGEAQKIESITVTANRRNETLQKVSGVVQTVTGDQLRRDGVTEMRNLQNVIPGANIAVQEGNVEIYIRGVGSANNTELGDPAASSHFNGVYIPRARGMGLMFSALNRVEVNKGPQGTLYGRNAMAGTLNIIPASPKFGRFEGYVQAGVASRGGSDAELALNIPVSDKFALRVAGQFMKRDAGFVNANPQPQYANLKPTGLEENSAARISALWYPTEDLRISVVADAGKEKGTGYPASNVFQSLKGGQRNADGTIAGPRNPDDLDFRRVVYRGQQAEANNEISGLMGKIEYTLGPVVAELNVSNRKVDFYQRNAGADQIDYPGRDYTGANFDDFSTQFWQTISDSKIAELRLSQSDPAARLRWSTGIFGFKEDQQSAFFAMVDKGIFYSGTEFTMPIIDAKSSAIFADGTFDVTKSTRVLGGLRYTTEEKYRYGIGGNWVLGLGADGFDCCFSTRLGTEGFVPALLDRSSFNVKGLTPAQQTQFLINSVKVAGARDTLIRQANGECFSRPDIDDNGRVKCPPGGGFTYGDAVKGIPAQQEGRSSAKYSDFRVGFEHDLSRDQMVYGKISTGHKAGGFNDSLGEGLIPEVYKPERVTVYEAGFRNAFGPANNRSVFNLTGFYYDYRDQVFQDLTCFAQSLNGAGCTGFSLVNRNVAKSRIMGLEAEFRTQLAKNLRLDLNGSFLSTKIVNGSVADARSQSFAGDDGGRTTIINLAGNKLPYVSPVSIVARLQHEFALGGGKFDWQALVNYRSAYFLTQYNDRPVTYVNGTSQAAVEAGFPDRQKGYATLNIGAGYTLNGFRLEGYVNNATDKQISTKALSSSGLNIRFLNDKRAVGLRVRYAF